MIPLQTFDRFFCFSPASSCQFLIRKFCKDKEKETLLSNHAVCLCDDPVTMHTTLRYPQQAWQKLLVPIQIILHKQVVREQITKEQQHWSEPGKQEFHFL
jgi:hypothetical protein